MEYFKTAEKTTGSILDSDDSTRFRVAAFHEYYTKRSATQQRLKYELLPEHIEKLLGYNLMELIDFSSINVISVRHAYGT